jgi:hypothetical protein
MTHKSKKVSDLKYRQHGPINSTAQGNEHENIPLLGQFLSSNLSDLFMPVLFQCGEFDLSDA